MHFFWVTPIIVELPGTNTDDPFTEGRPELITKPRPLAVIRNRRLNSVALLDPLRSVPATQLLCTVSMFLFEILTVP